MFTIPHNRIKNPRGHVINLNGIAPHSVTDRLVFVAPAGIHLLIVLAHLFVRTVTAPSVIKTKQIWLTVQLGGIDTIFLMLPFFDNVIDAKVALSFSPNFIMSPGDTMKVKTLDGCTGGTADYGANIISYDLN